MTEQAAPRYRSAGREEEASGWAVGFILFAGIMMIMAGAFQAFAGLVALFENEFWALTVIALDIFVIWALAAHGREVATDRY